MRVQLNEERVDSAAKRRAVRAVIERSDLDEVVVPEPETEPECIRILAINEQLDAVDHPPQSDNEWLAWLAERGVKQ